MLLYLQEQFRPSSSCSVEFDQSDALHPWRVAMWLAADDSQWETHGYLTITATNNSSAFRTGFVWWITDKAGRQLTIDMGAGSPCQEPWSHHWLLSMSPSNQNRLKVFLKHIHTCLWLVGGSGSIQREATNAQCEPAKSTQEELLWGSIFWGCQRSHCWVRRQIFERSKRGHLCSLWMTIFEQRGWLITPSAIYNAFWDPSQSHWATPFFTPCLMWWGTW